MIVVVSMMMFSAIYAASTTSELLRHRQEGCQARCETGNTTLDLPIMARQATAKQSKTNGMPQATAGDGDLPSCPRALPSLFAPLGFATARGRFSVKHSAQQKRWLSHTVTVDSPFVAPVI